MASSFSLSGDAVSLFNAVHSAAIAAAAAASAANNPAAGGSGASLTANILLNLNTGAQYSTTNSQQSNASSIAGCSVVTSSTQQLSQLAALNSNSTEKHEWLSRIENSPIDRAIMNKLVMNYLVTEGFKEAADKFQKETGISYSYDLESLNERIKIRDSIENGKIDDAIYLINKLHPELIDNNRILIFHLKQQQFIELIKEKRLEEALIFAQNHLCEYGENNEQIQEELERTMALLAFENPTDSPFSDYLLPAQRQRLACEINSAILEYENLESQTKLNLLIKMLLWSQDLLDKRQTSYPKIIDLGNARLEEASSSSSSQPTTTTTSAT